jgi:hypothetical protein
MIVPPTHHSMKFKNLGHAVVNTEGKVGGSVREMLSDCIELANSLGRGSVVNTTANGVRIPVFQNADLDALMKIYHRELDKIQKGILEAENRKSELTDEEKSVSRWSKLVAIKMVRERTGLGLWESKKMIDEYMSR